MLVLLFLPCFSIGEVKSMIVGELNINMNISGVGYYYDAAYSLLTSSVMMFQQA